MRPLQERFERTFCKCNQCKAACKTMPGSLAPGDLERISTYLGDEPPISPDPQDGAMFKPAFMRNFRASEGALVKRNGELMRIPTIVPAQREDGRCIFLSSKDECTISEVAPFGCAQFNVCDGPETEHEANKKSQSMLNAIMASVPYTLWWAWLKKNFPMVKPLKERRLDLEIELSKLITGQQPEHKEEQA